MGKRKRADFSSHFLALRSFSSIKVGLLFGEIECKSIVACGVFILYYIVCIEAQPTVARNMTATRSPYSC